MGRSPYKGMSEMLVPAACDACERVWLARSTGASTCPHCHGPARIVPGESYQPGDVPNFERIENAVRAARLPERVWTRLWATLSNVPERARRPEVLLLPVIDELPALQFLMQEGFRDRSRLTGAVGMLLVVISARLRFLAGARSHSA